MKHYFVDTSYLLEWWRVPGHFDPTLSGQVATKFERAWNARHAIFVHALCIIEVGNHIGHLSQQSQREQWAKALGRYLGQARSDDKNRPFAIVDDGVVDFFPLIDAWAAGEVTRGMGPVDAAVKHAAHSYKMGLLNKSIQVHIWTTDKALKREEPDTETE
jgi:hypothetical protein